MSSTDIASFLMGLPPSSIERIEILRTPSSSYEANNSGGILNIILKRGVNIGLSMSINAGINQGRYGSQFNGISISSVKKRSSSYLNLNYNRQLFYDKIETERRLTTDTLIRQAASNLASQKSLAIIYGISFELNKKIHISYDGITTYNSKPNSSATESQINKLNTGRTITSVNNTLINSLHGQNWNQAASINYKIDTLGSEIKTDFLFNSILNNSNQNYDFILVEPETSKTTENGSILTKVNQTAFKLDLILKYSGKLSIELGVKKSALKFKSNTAFFNGGKQDFYRTNDYKYFENTNSAYFQTTKVLHLVSIKFGSRIEQTHMYGHEIIPRDTVYSVNKIFIFPYFFISRNLTKLFNYQFSGNLIFRSSILRPNYENLNPFPKFIDQYLSESGNPGLFPQITQNFEANISVGDKPAVAIGRNYSQDVFTNITYRDPQNPINSIRTYENIGKNEETYIRLMAATPSGRANLLVLGSQYNLNKYTGNFQSYAVAFRRKSLLLFMLYQLKLNKYSTFSINGFYRFKGQIQLYNLSNYGNINLSFNQYFWNRKFLLAVSVTDILSTNKYKFSVEQVNIFTEGSRRSDTRRIGLSLRYNLGTKKKEENLKLWEINDL